MVWPAMTMELFRLEMFIAFVLFRFPKPKALPFSYICMDFVYQNDIGGYKKDQVARRNWFLVWGCLTKLCGRRRRITTHKNTTYLIKPCRL